MKQRTASIEEKRQATLRITDLLAWIVGASVSAAGYWYVAVYLLDQFNHGYGRLAWFQLSLYLSMISVVLGLLGYAVVMGLRRRTRTLFVAFLAGIVFSACELTFVFALESAFPDRDRTLEGFAAALAIGALSALVGRLNAD